MMISITHLIGVIIAAVAIGILIGGYGHEYVRGFFE